MYVCMYVCIACTTSPFSSVSVQSMYVCMYELHVCMYVLWFKYSLSLSLSFGKVRSFVIVPCRERVYQEELSYSPLGFGQRLYLVCSKCHSIDRVLMMAGRYQMPSKFMEPVEHMDPPEVLVNQWSQFDFIQHQVLIMEGVFCHLRTWPGQCVQRLHPTSNSIVQAFRVRWLALYTSRIRVLTPSLFITTSHWKSCSSLCDTWCGG